MGLMRGLFGSAAGATAIGQAAAGLVEVFTPNATKKMERSHEAYIAALDEHGAEFQYVRLGMFDRFVNGLNRMPRPMLAFGTLGLFAYAMIDPISFAQRMVGLAYVPEPLWWLLGAIVSFYFGAREAHYFRTRPAVDLPDTQPATPAADDNPALADWRGERTP